MTDYEALKRALKLMDIDFDDSVILHDGKRTVWIGDCDGLASLTWHFDYDTEEFVGTFVWNKSESLGFDEDGSPACCCKKCKELKERIRERWGTV